MNYDISRRWIIPTDLFCPRLVNGTPAHPDVTQRCKLLQLGQASVMAMDKKHIP